MMLQLNPEAESFLLWGLYTMLFGVLAQATSRHPPLPKCLCWLPSEQTPEALPSTILFVSSFFSPVLESWLLHTTYMTLLRSVPDPRSQLAGSFHPGVPYPLRSRAKSSCHSIEQGAFLKRYVYYALSFLLQPDWVPLKSAPVREGRKQDSRAEFRSLP